MCFYIFLTVCVVRLLLQCVFLLQCVYVRLDFCCTVSVSKWDLCQSSVRVMVTATLADRYPAVMHIFRNYDQPFKRPHTDSESSESNRFASVSPPSGESIHRTAQPTTNTVLCVFDVSSGESIHRTPQPTTNTVLCVFDVSSGESIHRTAQPTTNTVLCVFDVSSGESFHRTAQPTTNTLLCVFDVSSGESIHRTAQPTTNTLLLICQ